MPWRHIEAPLCYTTAGSEHYNLYLLASCPVQDANGQVIGAQCRDTITGRRFEVHAKVVINATGGGRIHM